MKFLKSMTLAAILSFSSVLAFSHEGHDHDAPLTVTPKKGGLIKGLENVYVEVVAKGKDIKIYVYDQEMKTQDLKDFKITASAELPRGKAKPEALKLAAVEDYLQTSFDAKSQHRYVLTVSVTDPKEGHADNLKFNIENKK